jgi:molybdopterin converting factor small subunit
VSIKINLHKTHRQYTDGLEHIDVEGGTVGECLGRLVDSYPEMSSALFDNKGKLLNVIEIYVNHESAYPEELKKPVKDGDVIHITVMLAGG